MKKGIINRRCSDVFGERRKGLPCSSRVCVKENWAWFLRDHARLCWDQVRCYACYQAVDHEREHIKVPVRPASLCIVQLHSIFIHQDYELLCYFQIILSPSLLPQAVVPHSYCSGTSPECPPHWPTWWTPLLYVYRWRKEMIKLQQLLSELEELR